MSALIPSILREAHRLRLHLRELQTEIDLGPRVLKIRQQKLAAEEQAHKDSYEIIKKLKLKQKEDEGALRQTEQRLDKLATDLNTAGSKKEFDAKQHEIEMATTKKGEFEDAILSAMTELEERTANIPAVEKQWADAQAEFAQYQRDAQERLDRLLADQKVCLTQLAEWEAKLPIDIKQQYERLVKAYGPDGLAGLKVRSCQNCRTTITEQSRNNVLSGIFVCCPNCGRGLYVLD